MLGFHRSRRPSTPSISRRPAIFAPSGGTVVFLALFLAVQPKLQASTVQTQLPPKLSGLAALSAGLQSKPAYPDPQEFLRLDDSLHATLAYLSMRTMNWQKLMARTQSEMDVKGDSALFVDSVGMDVLRAQLQVMGFEPIEAILGAAEGLWERGDTANAWPAMGAARYYTLQLNETYQELARRSGELVGKSEMDMLLRDVLRDFARQEGNGVDSLDKK